MIPSGLSSALYCVKTNFYGGIGSDAIIANAFGRENKQFYLARFVVLNAIIFSWRC